MRSNFIVSKHAVWSFTGRNRETERDFSAEPPESTGIPLAYTNARTQRGQKIQFLAFRAEFQIFANSGQSPLKTKTRAKRRRPASDARGKTHTHALCRILATALLHTSVMYGFCRVPDGLAYGLGPALNGLERPCAVHRRKPPVFANQNATHMFAPIQDLCASYYTPPSKHSRTTPPGNLY